MIVQNGINDISSQTDLRRTEQDQAEAPEGEVKRNSALTSSSEEDQVTVSQAWGQVAGQFDVRNATPRDIITLSKSLYEAQAITYDDHINLSFQPEDNADTPTESKPFSHDRKDYISVWQNKLDNVVRSGGDREQIEEHHRIQAILTYVDSLKQ